jgi:putative transposase
MDPLEWLRKQLEIADVDPLRELVQRVAEALMSADANAVCGAGDGERSPDRVNVRNGDRTRPWDTRVGTIDLAVPKLRSGSHIPGWRWNLGGGPSVLWSRSSPRPTSPACRPPGGGPGAGAGGAAVEQVPGIGARSLVGRAGGRVPRPALDAGPYPYVWVDALAIRCRDDHRIHRIVNVAVVLATAVNRDGHREILGVDLVTTEDGAGWTTFLRGLVARGLSGVQLVTSDAHEGLKAAIAAVLPGACWQRCRTHRSRKESRCRCVGVRRGG